MKKAEKNKLDEALLREGFDPRIGFIRRFSEKTWLRIIALVSLVIIGIIAFLIFAGEPDKEVNSAIYFFPKFNAFLNGSVAIFLISGFIAVRKKNITVHQSFMVAAFCFSIIFLISYLYYHGSAPETKFGDLDHDGVVTAIEKNARPSWHFLAYYVVLLTHIVLAAVVVPLCLITLIRIWRGEVKKHKKIARYTFPIWLYVSITGVVVYLMLSPYYAI